MITKITTENAAKYRALFTRATDDLVSHGVVRLDSNHDRYLAVSIGPEEFVPGDFWKETSAGHYAVTTLDEDYDPTARYFVQIRGGAINSLDEYFMYIKDLMNINPIYTILPMDENIFTIDADTRTITIPAAFRQNGVSVQSDVISEILYFSIDRFYDAEDLANDDIFIEWRTPSLKDGTMFEGVSKPWAIDLQDAPGKIIFGWPLSAEITQIPGELTFSVRFYRYEEETKTLQYSLSTLPNKVTIKAGIDLSKNVEAHLEDPYSLVDASTLLRARLVNSEDYGSNVVQPVAPVIHTTDAINTAVETDTFILYRDVDTGNRSVNTASENILYSYVPTTNRERNQTIGNKYDEYLLYLTDRDYNAIPHYLADGTLANPTGADLHNKLNQNAKARVRAMITDTGALSYNWIKLGGEDSHLMNQDWFTSGIEYVKSTDTSFVEHRLYYYKKNNDYILYTDERSGDPTTTNVQDSTETGLYEQYSWVNVNSAVEGNSNAITSDDNPVRGSYQIRVTNRIDRKTNRTYGAVLRVQGPEVPVITDSLVPKDENLEPLYVNDNLVINGLPVYGAHFGDTGEDNTCALTVTAEVDAHGFTRFDWYRGQLNNDNTITWSNEKFTTLVQQRAPKAGEEDIIDVVQSTMTFTGIPYDSSSYSAANLGNDGIYKCVVSTILNPENADDMVTTEGTVDDPHISTVVRLTHLPTYGTFRYDSALQDLQYEITAQTAMGIDFIPDAHEQRLASDTFTCQWYKYSAGTDNTVLQNDRNAAIAGTYTPKAADLPIEGQNYIAEKIDPETNELIGYDLTTAIGSNDQLDDGLYYCIITNKYNGTEITQSSRFIRIVD